MALNNLQINEGRRLNTFDLFLNDKDNKVIYQAYEPFHDVALLFINGFIDFEKLIPLKDYIEAQSITDDKNALRLSIADAMQPIINPLRHYARKAGNTDLMNKMYANYSDIKSRLPETALYPYFKTIFAPLAVLITDKDALFLKYKIEQKYLDGILDKAKTFNDSIGKAEVVGLPATQANQDIDAKIKLLAGYITEMAELGIFFKTNHPEFYNGLLALKKQEKLGNRKNKATFNITDSETGEVLPTAKVISLSNKKTFVPNTKTIEGIQLGEQQFLVTCEGYYNKTVTAKIIRSKEVQVSVALVKK